MRSTGPFNILTGMSSNPDDSKDLLLWAITVLASPNDNFIAVYVLDDVSTNKQKIRLEARVNLSTSIGKGLIKETKSHPADFLLLHRSRDYSESARQADDIAKYCLKKAPEESTVASVGRHTRMQHIYLYIHKLKDETSYFEEGKGIGSSSPTTVLDRVFKDSFHFRKGSITMSKTENCPRPPPLQCFTHKEIMNATNCFHPDNKWTHHAVIPIEGTFGYLAPEYFMHGIVDEKTDVFAFEVLLLEIVRGRRPVDSERQNLLLWAMPLLESGDLASQVDPKLKG